MFDFLFQDERYDLKKQIDDLQRDLDFERRERAADAERLQMKTDIAAQDKRLEDIEARLKAEAKAEAAAVAKEYSEKAVEMSSKCAADFGSAVATLTEKVMDCLKEFKPVPAAVTVVPQTKEVHHGCKAD